jgi:hypothetical protein
VQAALELVGGFLELEAQARVVQVQVLQALGVEGKVVPALQVRVRVPQVLAERLEVDPVSLVVVVQWALAVRQASLGA